MTDKLIKVLKEGNAVVPFELIKSYKKINLTEQELIFIIYILNTNKMFNPKEISDNLNIKMTECLQLIESLSDKDIINIKQDYYFISDKTNLSLMYNVNMKNKEISIKLYDENKKVIDEMLVKY